MKAFQRVVNDFRVVDLNFSSRGLVKFEKVTILDSTFLHLNFHKHWRQNKFTHHDNCPLEVAGKSDYGNLILMQNAIQNGYLPLIAAQVADMTGSSIHSKMILLLAAIVSIIASPRSQGTSSISDHLKVISFFVVVFQWDVRSSIWWFYVTLLYLVFFVFEVVVPTKILNNPKVYLPLHSTFIVTANICLTDLIKTQQK